MATLQAASLTLGRVSELLQGVDRAKEVNTALPSHLFLASSLQDFWLLPA